MTSLAVLMGMLFWLGLIFIFGSKSDQVSIYNRKQFNHARIIEQSVWVVPIFCISIWALFTNQEDSFDLIVLACLVGCGAYGYEYFIFQPKLDYFIERASELYQGITYDHVEERYQFNAQKDALLINRDVPEYTNKRHLIDLHIDRVGKNSFGEYFWIKASANNMFETSIKPLELSAVKNLLRIRRDVYLQEFNEEPYYKRK